MLRNICHKNSVPQGYGKLDCSKQFVRTKTLPNFFFHVYIIFSVPPDQDQLWLGLTFQSQTNFNAPKCGFVIEGAEFKDGACNIVYLRTLKTHYPD